MQNLCFVFFSLQVNNKRYCTAIDFCLLFYSLESGKRERERKKKRQREREREKDDDVFMIVTNGSMKRVHPLPIDREPGMP